MQSLINKENCSISNEPKYQAEPLDQHDAPIMPEPQNQIDPLERCGIYKDYSELYKSLTTGIVDHIIRLDNKDGYETRKLIVRSDRIPSIGDIFCPTPKVTNNEIQFVDEK